MINIAVPGVSGRMGFAIAEHVLQDHDLQLSLAMVRPGHQLAGTKLLNSDVIISSAWHNNKIDVLIDFTLPDGVMEHLDYCLQHHIPMVIGATGLSEVQLQVIKQAAKKIPIVLAANFSIGVNICYKLISQAAKLIDSNWDMSIVDVHHKNKKDSPSGTAKQMAQILSDNSNRSLDEINIYSEREGDTVGEHTVTFASADEMIMIAHVAEDRSVFAKGAVLAARWVCASGRQPGLYSMLDVV